MLASGMLAISDFVDSDLIPHSRSLVISSTFELTTSNAVDTQPLLIRYHPCRQTKHLNLRQIHDERAHPYDLLLLSVT